MPAQNRLEELQRQRALLREHLAWLDREIAATGENRAGNASAAKPTAGFVAPPSPAPSPVEADPDQILRSYAAEPVNPAAVKRGCVIAFATGMLALAAAIFAIYLLYYS